MSDKAASLVAQAKQWASYYGNYPNGTEGAVLTVPLRIRAAWERNDADAFAEVFIDNGSLLVGDEQLRGREEIRSYMAEAFGGTYRGTSISEEPVEIQMLTDDTAIAITQGGICQVGESAVDPAGEYRAMWVIVQQHGDWRLAARQTSPISS
jgi:uncharacterized protein (TIGR02246 family)